MIIILLFELRKFLFVFNILCIFYTKVYKRESNKWFFFIFCDILFLGSEVYASGRYN